MTQDEIWIQRYEGVKAFILRHGRNPSKYDAEERGKYLNWIKHNKKLYKAGELKPERLEKFERLLQIFESFKRKNQYE